MNVADDVKQVIAKEMKLPVEQVDDDTKLSDLGAESLDIIEIVFSLEEKFDIDISTKTTVAPAADAGRTAGATDLADFATVGDICRAVQTLVDAKAQK